MGTYLLLIQRKLFFPLIGSRLRAQERLLINLNYEDSRTEAEERGFCFPTSTTEQLQDALAALTQAAERDQSAGGEAEMEEEGEEEWEEEFGEEVED